MITEKERLWVSALVDVCSVLEKYKLKYFLDTGTLLGAIRDHKFIPWDNDIDLGVVDFDFSKETILNFSYDIYIKGYNVTSTKDEITILGKDSDVEVNIKFYHSTKSYYYAFLGRFEGNIFCNILTTYFSKTIIFKVGYKKYYFYSLIAKFLFLVASFLPASFIKFLQRKSNYVVNEIRIDQSLLLEFEYITFYDNDFLVPVNYNDYLIYRYGSSWNIPNANYNYMEDDNSIIKK